MKKTIKVKKAEVGAKIVPIAGIAGGALSQIGEQGSFLNVAGDALSAGAAGFAAGGLPGAAIGAVFGGLKSAITGRKIRKQQQELRDRQEYATNYAISDANTAAAQAAYYLEHDTANTMKNGGNVGYAPVYVNDGETIMRPDGSVKRIPKKGRKTDSVLTIEPVGSYVFGGLVDSEYGKTYQDLAAEWFPPTKGYVTEFTEGTNKARAMIGEKYLAKRQMQRQQELGVKPKQKNLNIPAAEKGKHILPPEEEMSEEEYLGLGKIDLTPIDTFVLDGVTYKRNGDDYVVDPKYSTDPIVFEKPSNLFSTLSGINSLMTQASNVNSPIETFDYQPNRNTAAVVRNLSKNPYKLNKVIRDINNAANSAIHDVNQKGNTTGANMLARIALENTRQRNIEQAHQSASEFASKSAMNVGNFLATAGENDRRTMLQKQDVDMRNLAAARKAKDVYAQNVYNYARTFDKDAAQWKMDVNRLKIAEPFWNYGSINPLKIG